MRSAWGSRSAPASEVRRHCRLLPSAPLSDIEPISSLSNSASTLRVREQENAHRTVWSSATGVSSDFRKPVSPQYVIDRLSILPLNTNSSWRPPSVAFYVERAIESYVHVVQVHVHVENVLRIHARLLADQVDELLVVALVHGNRLLLLLRRLLLLLRLGSAQTDDGNQLRLLVERDLVARALLLVREMNGERRNEAKTLLDVEDLGLDETVVLTLRVNPTRNLPQSRDRQRPDRGPPTCRTYLLRTPPRPPSYVPHSPASTRASA